MNEEHSEIMDSLEESLVVIFLHIPIVAAAAGIKLPI